MISHTFKHELHDMKQDFQSLEPDRQQAVLGLLKPPTIAETLNCWKAANNKEFILEMFFEHIITEVSLQDLLEANQCIPRLSQENNQSKVL